jgi:hypothetical protein
MKTKKIITIILFIGLITSTAGFAQKKTTYTHPTKNFHFEAGINWKNVKHIEDDLIYEMHDPENCIHVMLWFTETMSPPKNYLEKMADMKAYSWETGPDETIINDREAWIIDGEGTVYKEQVKVMLASIPVYDKSHISHANHIAQYIIQVWCPIEKYESKKDEMEDILASVNVK